MPYRLGVGRPAYPIPWASRGRHHFKVPSRLPEAVLITPALARKFKFAGAMTTLHPLVDGGKTFVTYTDHQGIICMFQLYEDMEQLELAEVDHG